MIAAITLNTSIDRHYELPHCRIGDVHRVKEFSATAGGKGLNVARILHKLGEPVISGGFAGGDHGQFILHELQREGIPQNFTRIRGESRCCINIKDMESGVQTEFLEPGPVVSPEEFQAFLEDFKKFCATCSVITISGSLPKGLPSDTYAYLTTLARECGVRVLLDAGGEPLAQALCAKPFYIKPNEQEFALLNQSLQQLHDNGIFWTVTSCGAKGAMLCCQEGTFSAQPPQIRVSNTVGCGDAMTAAFAKAASCGMNGPDALRYAVAVSSASAMCHGTGDVRTEDVEEIHKSVVLRRL